MTLALNKEELLLCSKDSGVFFVYGELFSTSAGLDHPFTISQQASKQAGKRGRKARQASKAGKQGRQARQASKQESKQASNLLHYLGLLKILGAMVKNCGCAHHCQILFALPSKRAKKHRKKMQN